MRTLLLFPVGVGLGVVDDLAIIATGVKANVNSLDLLALFGRLDSKAKNLVDKFESTKDGIESICLTKTSANHQCQGWLVLSNSCCLSLSALPCQSVDDMCGECLEQVAHGALHRKAHSPTSIVGARSA